MDVALVLVVVADDATDVTMAACVAIAESFSKCLEFIWILVAECDVFLSVVATIVCVAVLLSKAFAFILMRRLTYC